MWAYLLSKPRTESKSEDVELEQAESEFMLPATNAYPIGVRPLFVHVGKKRVWVLVKADLNDEQASILSDNDRLLTGTTKLLWWEPIMSSDFQRTLIENEKEEPGFKVCKIDLGKVGDKEAAVLAMLVKNLPDGPDKAELLEVLAGQANSAVAELEELATLLKADAPEGVNKERALAFLAEKVGTLPDGPDKDRLLEALRRDAKKPEAKPDFSGFTGELETLVPLIKKVATSPALLVMLTKYLPDGPDKAELLTTLAGYQANAAMAELEELEERKTLLTTTKKPSASRV
jgi:hypothetical protein